MCTVTFLPLGQGDFIITSNRDERKTRNTIPPAPYNIFGTEVYFPKDTEAGGTWFAASKTYTLVLLNGAAHKHHHNPPYRKSRGLVMLDFFGYSNPAEYAYRYNFEGIEPFTLVIINPDLKTLHQFRWNEKMPELIEKDFEDSHIWSSATLYDSETRKRREVWFEQWKNEGNEFTVDNILRFHHFGGTGNIETDLVMNRSNRVQTVSISSFEKRHNVSTFCYEDLIENKRHTVIL
ncbi:MAG: NRDE family protein [Bacteroidetes bacterium]|nr:MAG: NRDE family protein [Bacteroidota bacterium]